MFAGGDDATIETMRDVRRAARASPSSSPTTSSTSSATTRTRQDAGHRPARARTDHAGAAAAPGGARRDRARGPPGCSQLLDSDLADDDALAGAVAAAARAPRHRRGPRPWPCGGRPDAADAARAAARTARRGARSRPSPRPSPTVPASRRRPAVHDQPICTRRPGVVTFLTRCSDGLKAGGAAAGQDLQDPHGGRPGPSTPTQAHRPTRPVSRVRGGSGGQRAV